MNQCRVLIKLPHHHAHINVFDDHIHVFKYNDKTCDFDVFDLDQQYEASDYITEQLPTIQYVVQVNE
jgi:hypothetical protein